MGKYLLRRILQMIPVVLGTTLLVYALVFALPGDPVKAMFGDKPVNEAVAAQIRAEYHLDQPFIVQYFIYLKNALTLNFGDTFAGQPVLDEITRAFPVTIRLGLMVTGKARVISSRTGWPAKVSPKFKVSAFFR